MTKQQQQFFTHQYPTWLLKHPGRIHWIYSVNFFVQLRKWYIYRKLQKLFAATKKPFSVLDAGCGEGQFLFPFARTAKASFFKGIDREAANIIFGNRYIEDQQLSNTSLELMEMEQLKETEQYDIVLCISVLPYSKNDQASVQCIYHAMKKGGTLLLYVPVNNKSILPFYKKLLTRYDNYETIQQNQRVYTEPGIIKLLQDCNFQLTETNATYGFFGKLSNELLNTHLILYNAYPWLVKMMVAVSLLIFYPLILICMVLDYLLPLRSGNGLLVLAKK